MDQCLPAPHRCPPPSEHIPHRLQSGMEEASTPFSSVLGPVRVTARLQSQAQILACFSACRCFAPGPLSTPHIASPSQLISFLPLRASPREGNTFLPGPLQFLEPFWTCFAA